MGEAIPGARIVNDDVIRPRERPLLTGGSLAILRGNVCPDGAVLKVSAASQRAAPARGAGRRLPRASTRCTPRSTIRPSTSARTMSSSSRTAGPVGAPGMPEIGHLPMPDVPAAPGRDRHGPDQRRPDERHGLRHGRPPRRPPSRPIGGPLALVRTGDRIRLDTAGRRLDVLVGDEELAERRAGVGAAAAARHPRLSRAVPADGHAGERGLRPGLPRREVSAGAGRDHARVRGRDGALSGPGG